MNRADLSFGHGPANPSGIFDMPCPYCEYRLGEMIVVPGSEKGPRRGERRRGYLA